MKNQNQPNKEEKPEKIKGANGSFFDRIPYAVKAIFIKYWFFGAIYFFIVMGLGELLPTSTDYVAIVMGVAIGFVTDFLVNNILVTIESGEHEAHYYYMFKSKKIYSVLINLVYGLVLAIILWLLCNLIIGALSSYKGLDWILREPLTYALLATIIDAIFILGKNMSVKLYRHLTHKEVS